MNPLDTLGAGRRPVLVVIILAAVAAMWGFGRWATAPAWVPLVQGADLQAVGDITSGLDDAGIPYRLEAGGTGVSVTEAELARARVALAGEGLTPGRRPGFELFDRPSWGMTEFTQRVNYRRALEGELQRSIATMRGVDDAQVHLALEESSLIRQSSRPAEASIVLSLRRNGSWDPGMVEGVQALVAGSVEGLTTENVTVMDDSGRLLSLAASPGGMGGSARQLEMRQDVEEYLESKAQALLDRVVGPENATIRVAADLDFDRLDRTTHEVDPESRVPVQEQLEEIIPGNEDQGASSVSSSSTFETSRSVETLTREGVRIARLSVAVLVDDKTAEGAPWPSGELARIQSLVRNAVGLDPARGDEISVQAVPLDPVSVPGATATPAPGPGILEWVRVLQRPVLGLLGVLVTLLLVFRLLGQLGASAPVARSLAGAPDAVGLPAGSGGGSVAEAQRPAARSRPDLPPPRAVEVERPEMTARVVRAWMKEA